MTMVTNYPLRTNNNANTDTLITVKVTLTTKIVANSLLQVKFLKPHVESKGSTYTCNKIVSGFSSSVACSQVAVDAN